MQSTAVKVRYETLRSLAFGSVGASYTAVGSALANPVRILKVTNLTDANILVSMDGVNNMDIVAANGFYLYDFASNASDRGGLLEQQANQIVYVKRESGAPSTGSIYVTIIYAST